MAPRIAGPRAARGWIPALLAACAQATSPADAAPDGLGACGAPATRLHHIQGSGASSPLLGLSGVVVEGVVVGDLQGFPSGLGGFFLQEEDAHADADPATSEGIFVFDAGSGADVASGDTVRVRGDVREFFGLTELGRVSGLAVCGSGARASAARVSLPVADLGTWERWEGMRVRLEQPLVLTGHHDLGRFGELDLAAGGRLWQPTHWVAPGAAARAFAARNERHRIRLDDGSHRIDPRPPPFLDPASGAGLRLGDRLAGVEGVLDFAFGRYRIHPLEPLRFEVGSPRPASPPEVAGTLRVVVWNLANFFNGDGRGGGFPTRGARSPLELDRQRAKLIETLARLDPDLVALVELENDGIGPGSALRELADALAPRVPDGSFRAIDPGGASLGSQAIAVGLLYRDAAVAPVGAPAVLDARAHPEFDDTRNRPSLAASFEARATGERFTLAVSHLKSKGSPCDAAGDPDLGDGQGDCNLTRSRAARALAEWLAEDPTRAQTAGALLVGDLNAHPREDPVRALESAGFVDLVARFAGLDAYSYVFDGEAGRLDHALAEADLAPLVGGAAVWHTNADELPLLDYREDRPPELFAPDPFRASDHDPILIGLFPDADGDGLSDARDACPHSPPSDTVVLGDCDSGIPESLDARGCSLGDALLALAETARHRGELASEVNRWLDRRIAEGVLEARHRGALLACVATSAGGAPRDRDAPPSSDRGSSRRRTTGGTSGGLPTR